MSTTTYKLILVGPWPGLASCAAEVASPSWGEAGLNDDDRFVTLDYVLPDADDTTAATDSDDAGGESPAERARLLLLELEKEGSELEDALQENFMSVGEELPGFADVTAIAPVCEPEPATDSKPVLPDVVISTALGCCSEETEALLRDLEAILPGVTTPPHSPAAQTTSEEHAMFTDIDELLFLRSLSLPDPEPASYLPPTPSSSVSHSSPVPSPYASPTMLSPAHTTLPSQLSPSPSYAPSMAESSPYPASTTSWDSDNTSDPDWAMDDAPGPSHSRKAAAPRAKPYSKPTVGRGRQPEDRRERKKLQNKNAATRYRMKKKVEDDVLLEEEMDLQDKNHELQGKVDDLANEIRIIKGLLRDQCVRMGIIKKQ